MDTVIDRITTTKKGRYALFCAGEFLFSVDEDTYVRYGIRKGRALSGEELAEMRAASDNRRAVDKALDLLSAREHATFELQKKLERTFDAETARHAVGRVRELGLLDDERFARNYAEELLQRKGLSLRAARDKLLEKGVPREAADEALSAYENDESAAVRELIEKKYARRLAAENGRQAVFAALQRKGFSARDIRAALAAYGAETDEEF